MLRKFWRIAVSIGLLILVLLTLSISLQLELPAPGGPYAVGRTIFRWIDTSRQEILTDDRGDFREVSALVRIYHAD